MYPVWLYHITGERVTVLLLIGLYYDVSDWCWPSVIDQENKKMTKKQDVFVKHEHVPRPRSIFSLK